MFNALFGLGSILHLGMLGKKQLHKSAFTIHEREMAKRNGEPYYYDLYSQHHRLTETNQIVYVSKLEGHHKVFDENNKLLFDLNQDKFDKIFAESSEIAHKYKMKFIFTEENECYKVNLNEHPELSEYVGKEICVPYYNYVPYQAYYLREHHKEGCCCKYLFPTEYQEKLDKDLYDATGYTIDVKTLHKIYYDIEDDLYNSRILVDSYKQANAQKDLDIELNSFEEPNRRNLNVSIVVLEGVKKGKVPDSCAAFCVNELKDLKKYYITECCRGYVVDDSYDLEEAYKKLVDVIIEKKDTTFSKWALYDCDYNKLNTVEEVKDFYQKHKGDFWA